MEVINGSPYRYLQSLYNVQFNFCDTRKCLQTKVRTIRSGTYIGK